MTQRSKYLDAYGLKFSSSNPFKLFGDIDTVAFLSIDYCKLKIEEQLSDEHK